MITGPVAAPDTLPGHWVPEPLPSSEEALRLAALRERELLDTPPEPRFDALTRLARHVTGTSIALLSLVDEDRQWFKSNQGLEGITQTPRDVAFCAHAVRRGRPLVVDDAMADPRFVTNPLVTGGPRIRFYAGVPLATPEGLVLGTLCVLDVVPRSLTQAQLDSLRDLGEAASALIEARADQLRRARAQEQLRRGEGRLRALIDAAPAAIGRVDAAGRIEIANRTFSAWFAPAGAAAAGVALADGVAPAQREALQAALGRAMQGQRAECEARLAGGAAREVRIVLVPDGPADEAAAGAYVLVADITEVRAEELARRNRMLQELGERMHADIEAERRRIAGSLHDQTGQDLTALRVMAGRLAQRFDGEVAEVARQMMRVVDSATVAVRRLINNLRPLVLDDLGLAAATQALALDFEQASGIAFDLDLAAFDPAPPLPDAHTTALYRVLQECLTNVVRHAQATEVSIVLKSEPCGGVRLVVADNGRGFDRAAGSPHTYGLLGIDERIRRIGGTVRIDSAPGRGTRVETLLPAQGSA